MIVLDGAALRLAADDEEALAVGLGLALDPGRCRTDEVLQYGSARFSMSPFPPSSPLTLYSPN